MINKIITLVFVFTLSIAFPLFSETCINANDAFKLLNKAFRKHVTGGLVDYAEIAHDENFVTFLKWLEKAEPEKSPYRKTKMAFWINAYNALAVQNVINNSNPAKNNWVKSVLDVEGFFNKQTHKVAGQELTLDALEKQVAFPQFKDARLHFAFVCAAKSCPQLQSTAYAGTNIDSLVTAVAQKFLQNPQKNYLDKEKKILYLSQIFNWYRSDFEPGNKSLIDTLEQYFDETTQDFLQRNKVEIKFLEYDWSLNIKT